MSTAYYSHLSYEAPLSDQSMFEAARGGVWAPSLELLLSFGSGLWLLEMILVLPTPMFMLVAWCVGMPIPDLISPGQADILAGRKTEASNQLEEMIGAGTRHQNPIPVSSAVFNMLKIIEGTPGGLVGNSSAAAANKNELIRIIGRSNSVVELKYWLLRFLTLMSFLAAIYFFIFHD